MGFSIQGLGVGVWGSGLAVEGLGLEVTGVVFKAFSFLAKVVVLHAPHLAHRAIEPR